VWAFDFQFDQTADGRALKLLNVVDEFTRESLAMLVARSIDADTAVSVLGALAAERPAAIFAVHATGIVDLQRESEVGRDPDFLRRQGERAA